MLFFITSLSYALFFLLTWALTDTDHFFSILTSVDELKE